MTDPKIEKRGAGVHVVSEANGFRSREQVVVSSTVAGVLAVGTVLGKLTSGGEYMQVDLGGGDGEEVAAGVLFAEVDATDADANAVAHVRDCEVDGNLLVYPDGASQNDIDTINAQLADLGIIVRM